MRLIFRRTVVITWLCLLPLACTYRTAPAAKSTLLVDGLHSYLTPGQVRELVHVDTKEWKVIDDNKTAEGDKRPPFHDMVIATSRFYDLGERAEARFHFFNNRLMSIWVYPEAIDTYKAKLEKERKINFDLNMEAHFGANTKVKVRRDHTGRAYVSFEDLTLQEEFMGWISRYS